VVPVLAERESLARIRAAHHRRLQHRRRPLRLRPRPDGAPQPRQGRPGKDEDPPSARRAPRPGRGADLHLAHGGQAGRDDDRQPAQRRPGRLSVAQAGRVDHRHRVRDLAKPQVHRAHGLRPPPLHRPPSVPRRASGPVDLVPRADPPGDRHPRHLGHRPDHRRRARQRPRRRRAQHPPVRAPLLPAALPRPVPGLQTPHARHPGPPLHRPPRIRVLHLPAQPGQPPPHRQSPRPPPDRQGPRRRPTHRHPRILRHQDLRTRPQDHARRTAPRVGR